MGAFLLDRVGGPVTEADIAGAGDTRYMRIYTPDPGALWGMTMSTAGSSVTLTVAAGFAADSTNTRSMRLAASLAKTTSAWAAGAGGGLDTSTIANNTWYHFFLIMNVTTGVVDVVFSATATPASGPTTMPSGYTLFRRIGSALTNGSAQWVLFNQNGDEFLWDTPPQDASAVATATSASSLALSTPSGVKTNALLLLRGNYISGSAAVLFSALDQADVVPAALGADVNLLINTATTSPTAFLNLRTNTSKQVRVRSSATGSTYYVYTSGWIDTRGKNG